LIPWFDGAILSQEWKEALWDRFVTAAPRPRRPSELLLQVRFAIANGNLKERLAYQSPTQSKLPVISHFVPVPLFQRAA
jgi:hypothetical protein